MPRTLLAVLLLALCAPVASAQDVFDDAGEAAMLEQINALRAEQQLAPLARLDALDGAARAHSAEMARTGQLAHVSDATGSPEDRVRDAGVGATRVLENVASHRDTASASAAVMASPAHRQNALDPNATHVGLGSARTEQGVFVTQLFAALPALAAEAEAVAVPEAPAVEAEAPAPAAPEAAPMAGLPSFELIPPFVERAMDQAAPVASAVQGMIAPSAPEAAPAAPEAAPAAPEAPVAEAAPAAPAAPTASLSPMAQSTLRELVGLAQSLLGGGAQ